MSTKNKKASPTGVRYTDAQKKEVVDFVAQYNSSKGRGGQSAAAKKFKVTPLTIAAWIKASGAPKTKKAIKIVKNTKPVTAARPAKPGRSKKGVRYSTEQKQDVVDFVASYNAANGRGGQSKAASKFGLSVLTVATWLKKAGTSAKGTKALKAVAVPSGLASKVASLIAAGEQVRKAEVELQSLRAKYDALKSSIQASL
jgi:transposase-like protein